MPNGVCQINGCFEPAVAIVNRMGICSEHYRASRIETPMEDIITLGEKIFNPEKPKPWEWGIMGDKLILSDQDTRILQIHVADVDETLISENPRLQRMIANAERMYKLGLNIFQYRLDIDYSDAEELTSILADIEGE